MIILSVWLGKKVFLTDFDTLPAVSVFGPMWRRSSPHWLSDPTSCSTGVNLAVQKSLKSKQKKSIATDSIQKNVKMNHSREMGDSPLIVHSIVRKKSEIVCLSVPRHLRKSMGRGRGRGQCPLGLDLRGIGAMQHGAPTRPVGRAVWRVLLLRLV